MNKITLNFFGEEVSVDIPNSLASLRKEISEKFLFNPSDAAEIVVTYFKDLQKKIIQTEQDFVEFIKNKINKINLDINPESQLYQKSLIKLQEETSRDKEKLEELLKKREEIKTKRETGFQEKKKKIEELNQKIHDLTKRKNELSKKIKEGQAKLLEKQKKVDKNIYDLQKKLGLPITVKIQSKKPETKHQAKPQTKLHEKKQKKPVCKQTKKSVKSAKLKPIIKQLNKKPEKNKITIFNNVNEVVNNMIGKVNDIISQQMKNQQKEVEETEKKIEDSKIELKNEEKESFLNLKKLGSDAMEEFKKWTEFMVEHTNELTEAMSKKYKECAEFIKPLTEKLNDKSESNQTDIAGKIIHKGVMCDGCGAFPIIGNRFKCAVCENFDYCEACEEKFNKEHDHPFIKIYSPQIVPISIKCQMKENK